MSYNFKYNNADDRVVYDRKYNFERDNFNNFDITGTVLDVVNKYGTSFIYKQINDFKNKNIEGRELSPDVQNDENMFVYYRMEEMYPFLNDLKDKDKELLLESLTHFQWEDINDKSETIIKDLFAPLSFYTISRTKQINVTSVPGMDSSLKEYFANEDYNINCNILFYSHLEDVIPVKFLERFYEMVNSNRVIKVVNPFLNRQGINNIVITDHSIDQSNILNNQTVAFTALSEKYNVI